MSPMLVWLSAMLPLPARVARIARCELLADRQRGAIAAERVVDLPRRGMRVGDQVVGSAPAARATRARRAPASTTAASSLRACSAICRCCAILPSLPYWSASTSSSTACSPRRRGRAPPPGATAAAAPLPSCDRGRRRPLRPGAAAPRSRARNALLIGDADRPAELVGRDPDRLRQQAFGVLGIAPGHPAAGRRQHRQQQHRGADALPDAGAPAGRDQLALAQVVERHAEHARDQLELGVLLAVGLGAQVGGDRLGRLVCEAAGGIDLEAQRRRKAFALRRVGVRLAIDDQRQDAVGPAQPLELDDLLVDPAAAAPPPGCTARSGGPTAPAPRAAPRADRPTRRARRGRGTPGRFLLGIGPSGALRPTSGLGTR